MIKRVRRNKLHCPLKCTECGKILEIGDTYYDINSMRYICESCSQHFI